VIEQFLADLIIEDKDIVLVGTSLGGFWAHFFGYEFNLPVVIMNPSINPSVTLKRYADGRPTRVEGFTSAMADEYAYFEEQLYFVPLYDRVALFEEGEDILYAAANFNKYKGNSDAILIPGGSHKFENLDLLKEKIKEILEYAVF